MIVTDNEAFITGLRVGLILGHTVRLAPDAFARLFVSALGLHGAAEAAVMEILLQPSSPPPLTPGEQRAMAAAEGKGPTGTWG